MLQEVKATMVYSRVYELWALGADRLNEFAD